MNIQEYTKTVEKSYQSQYDICPICKTKTFYAKTRTQAVHHIYDCLALHNSEVEK